MPECLAPEKVSGTGKGVSPTMPKCLAPEKVSHPLCQSVWHRRRWLTRYARVSGTG
jgi:hypothetical protein